jgi:transketolase
MDCFGESGPAGELFKHFGFATDNVVKVAREII